MAGPTARECLPLLVVMSCCIILQPVCCSLQFYVIPDDPTTSSSSSPCPPPPYTSCMTLQQFAQNSSYFIPGANFTFLPGTHPIRSPLHVQPSHSSEEPLQLLGMEDGAIIHCEVPLSLSFSNFSRLTLSTLVVRDCGRPNQPALLFNSVNTLQLKRLRILNSSSTDIQALGVSNMTITDSSFSTEVEGASNSTDEAVCTDDNRSGVLCGACREGLSLTLGPPTCRECSNKQLSLLFVFLFMGPALVLFIKALDMTVSRATINGLLFYANVVWINRYLFFDSPRETLFTFGFLAWLNLDLGVVSCFYDGMDAYTLTWLQYLFPLYVCLLATLLVALPHCLPHPLIIKYIGTNSLSVLATVFLLVYTKILRNIVDSLKVSRVEVNQQSQVVWTLDGDYQYLNSPHVFLFTVAIILLLILWLPYTLFLLLGHRILPTLPRNRFTNQLMHLLDTYTSPLQQGKKFWVGLLLLARSLLLLASALVPPDRETLNILLTLLCSLLLLYLLTRWGGVYSSKSVGQFEASFLFNVAVLAAVEMYTVLTGVERRFGVIQTSTIVVFIKFTLLLVYHGYSRLRNIPNVKDFETRAKKRLPKRIQGNRMDTVRTISLTESLRINTNEGGSPSIDSQSLPSTTSWVGTLSTSRVGGRVSVGSGNSISASSVVVRREEQEKETEISQVRSRSYES